MDSEVFLNKPNNSDTATRVESIIEPSQLSFLEFDYTNLQKILQFGRDLFQMNASIESGESTVNKNMLRVSYTTHG